MCLEVGEVKISIDEQYTPGEKISKSPLLLLQGETVIAGCEFILATAGKHCIFIPVISEHEIQNISAKIVSALLANGVRTIQKRGKLEFSIDVYFFTSSMQKMLYMSANVGLRSVQMRYTEYTEVEKDCAIRVKRTA